jgi:hypothetical protein
MSRSWLDIEKIGRFYPSLRGDHEWPGMSEHGFEKAGGIGLDRAGPWLARRSVDPTGGPPSTSPPRPGRLSRWPGLAESFASGLLAF